MLVVTHQDRATLRQPTERALDHPATRFVAWRAGTTLLQLAHLLDVRRVLVFRCHALAWLIVECLVQAKVLRNLLGRLWTLHDDRFDGYFQELMIVDVSAVNDHAQRAAVRIDDQAAFRAIFPTVRRVGSD